MLDKNVTESLSLLSSQDVTEDTLETSLHIGHIIVLGTEHPFTPRRNRYIKMVDVPSSAKLFFLVVKLPFGHLYPQAFGVGLL